MENKNEKQITAANPDDVISKVASTIFLFMVIVFGIIARNYMLPMRSGDQYQFLEPWFEKITELGPAGTLKDGIGDYMPPYFWIMIIVNALPISNRIYGLKWVSSIADFFAAVFIMKIVKRVTGSDTKAELSFAAAFLMPTVLMNSAGWAQCDSIFTLFLIMCVYYLIEGKDIKAVTCFSVSFIFKLQAIFLGPLLLVMLLKGKIRLRSLIAFPVVYLAAILPSAACGHEFSSLFTIYFDQAGQYSMLNMTLPNIWSMVKDVNSEPLGQAGVMLAGVSCLTLIYYLYKRPQVPGVKGTVVLAALFTLFVPYVLPYMHERYYYTAALMSLLLVFVDKRLTPVWLVVEFSSATSHARFLLGKEEYDLRFTTFFVTAALITMFVYYCSLDGKDEEIVLAPAKPFMSLDDEEEEDETEETAEEEAAEGDEAGPAEEISEEASEKPDTSKKKNKKKPDEIEKRFGEGARI